MLFWAKLLGSSQLPGRTPELTMHTQYHWNLSIVHHGIIARQPGNISLGLDRPEKRELGDNPPYLVTISNQVIGMWDKFLGPNVPLIKLVSTLIIQEQ